MAQSFEDLEVWKRGCRLAVRVYEALEESRDWGLRDQMQRAAVSIPSNIAEGYEKTNKDFIRYLMIAKGSAAELRTQLYIAERVKSIKANEAKELIEEAKTIARMLQSLANYRTQTVNEDEPDYEILTDETPIWK